MTGNYWMNLPLYIMIIIISCDAYPNKHKHFLNSDIFKKINKHIKKKKLHTTNNLDKQNQEYSDDKRPILPYGYFPKTNVIEASKSEKSLRENFKPIPLNQDLGFPVTNKASNIYKLEDIQRQVVTKGFESRKFVEDLYQSKKDIFSKFAKILPGINASFSYGSIPESVLAATTGLFSFLIPGTWFSWDESRLFYESQKKSYQQLLSLKALEAENVYYNLHRLKIEYEIYNYYLKKLKTLIFYLEHSDKYSDIRIILIALQNLYFSLENKKIAIQYTIQTSIPEIQFLMGLKNFSSIFELTPIKLPQKLTIEYDKYDEDYIHKKSFDLSSLKLLKIAAKYSKQARIFNFINSNENGATASFVFDLSYFSDIQKKSSQIRKIQVCIEETESRINKTIELVKVKQKMAAYIYQRTLRWKKSNHDLASAFIDAVTGNQYIDIMMTIDIIDWAIDFETTKNYAQHLYLISQSELNFLRKEKKIYQNIEKILPRRSKLNIVKNPKKYLENRRMEKDILRGRIQSYLF